MFLGQIIGKINDRELRPLHTLFFVCAVITFFPFDVMCILLIIV